MFLIKLCFQGFMSFYLRFSWYTTDTKFCFVVYEPSKEAIKRGKYIGLVLHCIYSYVYTMQWAMIVYVNKVHYIQFMIIASCELVWIRGNRNGNSHFSWSREEFIQSICFCLPCCFLYITFIIFLWEMIGSIEMFQIKRGK